MEVIKTGLSYHCLWFVYFGCHGVFSSSFPNNDPNLLFRNPQVLRVVIPSQFSNPEAIARHAEKFSFRVSKSCVHFCTVKVVFLCLTMEGEEDTGRKRKGKFRSCRRKKRKGFHGKKSVGNAKGNRSGWRT